MAGLYYGDAVIRLRNAGCQVYRQGETGADTICAVHGTYAWNFKRQARGAFDAEEVDDFVATVRAADKRGLTR